MAKARAGWEKVLKYDSPGGATATTSTADEHIVDINVNKTPEFVETTDRGDSAAPPKVTQQVVARTCEITFSIRYYDGSTFIAALFASEKTGVPIAFVVEQYPTGEAVFDGDCCVTLDMPGELKGGQLIDVTLTPSQDLGRIWEDEVVGP